MTLLIINEVKGRKRNDVVTFDCPTVARLELGQNDLEVITCRQVIRVGENRRSSKDMNKMTDAKGGQDATTLSCLNFNCPKWSFPQSPPNSKSNRQNGGLNGGFKGQTALELSE
mgnify:CR=1 FL=1